MTTWPATLPAPAINSLQEAPPNNTIRTAMDKGPEKLRRRTTANIRPLSFNMVLTTTELAALDTFYVTTTYSGSESFDYTHPRTGVACTARFVSPPEYAEHEGSCYMVAVQLEILP